MNFFKIIFCIVIISMIQSCNSSAFVGGTYSNIYSGISGKELKFKNNPKTFEYINRVEMGFVDYSTGNWHKNKNIIILNGFDDKSLNILSLKYKVEDYPDNTKDKVVIHYLNNFPDTVIRVEAIINDRVIIPIKKDTVFLIDANLSNVKIKSYLQLTGYLLASPTRIDTLVSKGIKLDNKNLFRKKTIKLSIEFTVGWQDFYRVTLSDTLLIKNRKTILWNGKKFKRISD